MKFDPETLNASERIKRKFASSLSRTSPRNDLWTKIIEPSLIIPDLGVYTCLAVNRDSNHSQRSVLRLLDSHEDDEANQRLNQWDCQFFTNPFRFPNFGPETDRWTRQYYHKWQSPSLRTGIGYFWVFTLEHDPEDIDGFELQFDWLTQKDAKGFVLIDRIDAEFRRFKDYRGYNVTWSANKSFHIHLVFDTTHLSLATLESWCSANNKSTEARLRDHYQGADLSDHALKGYYSERWAKIVEVSQALIGETIQFDSNMAHLHQKRRLPWGMRKAARGNMFGIEAGIMVPQIVTAENIITTSPRGSAGYFLSPMDGNEFIQEQKRRPIDGRGHGHARPADMAEQQGRLLDGLQAYLAEQWGRSFPKPVSIEGDIGDLTVRFVNDESDCNPSTVCLSPNANLVPGGKSALQPGSPDLRLPHGQSIDEVVTAIQEQLVGEGMYQAPRNAAGSIFGERGTLDQRILAAQPRTKQGARDGLAAITEMALDQSDLNMFVSAEGVGKSFNLAHEAIRRRVEPSNRQRLGSDSGFNIFACLSYQQAEAQYQEWAENRDGQWPGSGDAQAVLLLSFAERYRRFCSRNEVKRITEGQAAQQGYDSLIEAVHALHRDAYDAITQEKNEAWMVAKDGSSISAFENRVTTMVFTTHAMAQRFNQIGKAKAWLHPEFDLAAQVSGGNRDYEERAEEFRAFQIIHDEIAPGDIAMIVSEADFEFAEKVRLSTETDWDHAKLPEKYRAYTSLAAQLEASNPYRARSFDDTRGIIEASLTTDDIVTVDYDAAPYGRDRTENGIYRSQSGRNFYVKEKNWWTKQKARISITTTERLPAMMMAAVAGSPSIDEDGCASENRLRVWRWDDDEVFAFRSVPVIRTSDASGQTSPDDQQKSKVEVLVENFLGEDGPDMVITDRVQHQSVVNHATARGRNDMADLNLATVIMHLAPEHYSLLNVIAQKFDLVDHHPDVIRLHYRDQINQALGRNQGFRRDEANPKEHVVLINQNLYNWLGADFFRDGRYPMHLVKA